MPKKLFEIKMVAAKSFHVEARSQKAALESDIVSEEESVGTLSNLVDWEHIETEVNEVNAEQAKYLRRNPHRQIYRANP